MYKPSDSRFRARLMIWKSMSLSAARFHFVEVKIGLARAEPARRRVARVVNMMLMIFGLFG